MLSRSSLAAELTALRDNLAQRADQQLIDGWIAHCNREDCDNAEKQWAALNVWTISESPMTAPELIRVMLEAWWRAEAVINQVYGWKVPSDEISRIRKKAQAEGRTVVQIAADVPGSNREWRHILEEGFDPSVRLKNIGLLERALELHADYVNLIGPLKEPSQVDRGGTRQQRLFWDFVGGYLRARFDGWFDDDVAVLTQIVFDLTDTVDPQRIRQARNS